MKLFNSYTNTVEEFKPIEENKVKMYVCGPTVYDYAHLGHARCYITWDVLYRYLKFKGYDVTYCRNVTDVDDKILKKADKEGKTPTEVSQYWYNHFEHSICHPGRPTPQGDLYPNFSSFFHNAKSSGSSF